MKTENKMSVHFSSSSNEWATPQWFFDSLNSEFNFSLDPCATKENAKCETFYTQEDDGLLKSWDNQSVFVNPPYGRSLSQWVKKAHEARGGVVVMLIPAKTDTRYFHEYIYQKSNVEIRFLKGRLKFGDSKNSAPFPSLIVVFRN
jgi:phage N-6-adenine-methyltransferase